MAENFGITKIPSKPTMSRILNLVDGKKVAEVIINLMKKFVSDDGVTADAMHCQRETCKKITRKGGEYVLTLKKNFCRLFVNIGSDFCLMSFLLKIYETPVG